MSAGFETPAYKLFISDVTRAKEIGEGEWELEINAAHLGFPRNDIRKQLRMKLIWIQGSVSNISNDSVSLKDDTGEARIEDIRSVPGGDHPEIALDSYVGIMGQIISITPTVVIKAVKIMCLANKPLLKKMWADEVKTLQAYLVELLIPDCTD